MKERPILFSGPMVRAILDGRKTQTRRIIKPQPPEHIDALHGGKLRQRAPYNVESNETGAIIGFGFSDDSERIYRCPYGQPGDRLWVRETWGIQAGIRACATDTPNRWNGQFWEPVTHRAGTENYAWGMYGPPKWKPSIHMPRTGCRIVLGVISVRVERLHDISEEDIISEGTEYAVAKGETMPARNAWQCLWMSINGRKSWETNPWVWVIGFKRIQP